MRNGGTGGVPAAHPVHAGPRRSGSRTEIDPVEGCAVWIKRDARSKEQLQTIGSTSAKVASVQIGIVGLQFDRSKYSTLLHDIAESRRESFDLAFERVDDSVGYRTQINALWHVAVRPRRMRSSRGPRRIRNSRLTHQHKGAFGDFAARNSGFCSGDFQHCSADMHRPRQAAFVSGPRNRFAQHIVDLECPGTMAEPLHRRAVSIRKRIAAYRDKPVRADIKELRASARKLAE